MFVATMSKMRIRFRAGCRTESFALQKVCGVRRYGAALSEEDFFLSYNRDFRYSRLSRAMNFTLIPLGHAAWHS